MRLLLPLLFLLTATQLLAADLSILRVWPGYRSAESFDRISEYFTGRENTRGQSFLRSQPDERAGYYLFVRTKNLSDAAQAASVEVSIITPDSPHAKVITSFPPTTLPKGSHVFQIGLTGTDWADAQLQPVAWQLRFLAADGIELLRDQSFLWSQAPKK